MPDWRAMPGWDEARVAHVDRVHLAVEPHNWTFAASEREAIDDTWSKALRRNPAYFNGVIHLCSGATLSTHSLEASLFATDFKTYLHWRESGYSDRTIRDVFGSALIRSREGHVILGRQRDGHVNGGLTYLPGGFIDARDVVTTTASDCHIDIDASILREAAEETGLGAHDLSRKPGYYVTCTGPQVSVALELASIHSSCELRERAMAHIGADPHSELTDIAVVKHKSDLDGLAMPSFVGVLLGALFS